MASKIERSCWVERNWWRKWAMWKSGWRVKWNWQPKRKADRFPFVFLLAFPFFSQQKMAPFGFCLFSYSCSGNSSRLWEVAASQLQKVKTFTPLSIATYLDLAIFTPLFIALSQDLYLLANIHLFLDCLSWLDTTHVFLYSAILQPISTW